jgi:hypothetical protein
MNLRSMMSAAAAALRGAARLSLPTVRRAGSMSPKEWLALSGHVIALAIALTSTIGIYNFGVGLAGGSLIFTWLLVPVAIFVGVMLQIVIISCIKLIVREWRQNRALAVLAGVVVSLMWAITVGASYGSYWNLMSRDSYEQRATQQTINTAAVPLENARSRFASATQALVDVSKHADQMMVVENDEGRSCGYNAGTGPGDRWQLRKRQKDEAAGHAASLTALNKSLTQSLNSMSTFNDAALATAYRAASDALGAPSVGRAKNWIDEQRAGFKSGFAINGGAINCGDPTMVRLLDDAVSSLNALPKVPSTPPRVTRLSNTEGMLLSFARLFNFGEGDQLVRDSDYVPLLFPILIEFIMTALIVIGELGRPRDAFSGAPGFSPNDNPHRPINPSLAMFIQKHAGGGSALDLYDHLANHLIELDGAPTICFAVSADPGEQREFGRKLLVLVARHDPQGRSHPLTPYRQRLPFAELPPLVTAGWPWKSQYVDIHLVPRALAHEVRRMIAWQAEAEIFPAQ